MSISRREFLQLMAIASAAGLALPGCSTMSRRKFQRAPDDFYDVPKFGNVSLMHFTDCHAQLNPIWFREPNINIGIKQMNGRPPHLVGKHLLKYFGTKEHTALAYAHTYLDYVEAAQVYGKVGGFSHLATLIQQLRATRPNSLLLDGGDTWQGSATSLWTDGQDMVDACLMLGVDAMTAHWEFTYGASRVSEIIDKSLHGKMDFLAQNVIDTEWEEPVFQPYTLREMNGVQVAIIGQAFPYTPIANPRYMVPDWSFGIRDDELQKVVDRVYSKGAEVVVLLSHNGMDVDIKLASRVTGLHAILGGHTHDALPGPFPVKNPSGKSTLVVNSGSNGKFLSVLDFDVRNGEVKGHQFNILPIFSNLLKPDAKMETHIKKVREPFKEKLDEKLAVTDELLYRRGNFNGTFDQVILDALIKVKDAEIAFSPGFRWGVSKLPGEAVTFEDLMTQTAITYPATTINLTDGARLKDILEDVCDNLFNKDPYYQQGGDMVRVAGLEFSIDPLQEIGNRISDMTLNGKPIDAKKKYKVAGWASVHQQPEDATPIWDVVAEYMRDQKTIKIKKLNEPKIKNLGPNPGYAKL